MKIACPDQLRALLAPIDSIRPDPGNPRTGHDIDAISASLRELGWHSAIVVDETGVVSVGHGRLEAARKLGETEVPVLRIAEDRLRSIARNVVDNQTSALSGWDLEKLSAAVDLSPLLASMSVDLGLDGVLDGFVVPDVADTNVDAEPQVDRAEELRAKWGVEPGQIWTLGEHRIMCGDSTKAEDVERVMGGERAGLMNTDPPYGVSYDNADRPNPGVAKPRVAKPRVAKDELRDSELQAFLERAFRAAKDVALKENAAWYLWHAHLTQGFFAAAAAAAAAAVILHRQIIWVKPVFLLGRGQYHWKHEPCFFGWVQGHQPPDYGCGSGERNQTTVWEVASVTHDERREFNHSTPKPVGLFTIPIVKHLRPGEIAYEPFCGSAPQIIACEQLGRRCRAIEISPGYVAVAIQRWADATGKTPVLEAP